MKQNPTTLMISLLLAAALAGLPGGGTTAWAGDGGEWNAGFQFDNPVSSASDDQQTENILVGLFIVVAVILIVLGIQSDRAWNSSRAAPAAPLQQLAAPAADGLPAGLDQGWMAEPLREDFEFRMVDNRAEAGLSFRF
jgi:hypothetical protein